MYAKDNYFIVKNISGGFKMDFMNIKSLKYENENLDKINKYCDGVFQYSPSPKLAPYLQ